MNAEDDKVLRRAALKSGEIVDKGRLGSDTMRDAFEAWDCQEFCIDAEHYKQVNGTYVDAPIRNRWLTWQAAQSQPAPPVPDSVQEIMRLMNPYVRACAGFDASIDELDDAKAEIAEAYKPLEAALAALVDDNHRLKFELDGMRAMRRPLTDERIPELRDRYGITSNGRGIKEFTQVADFARAVLTTSAPPQESMSLRESADRLAEAGHDFWAACKKDAGGGAVRWLDFSDGTLIIFTRGEYRKALLASVDEIPGIPVVRFQDDGDDDSGTVTAIEKAHGIEPEQGESHE